MEGHVLSYKYFTLDEFDCQETGENEMKPEFLEKLDELRERCGFSFRIGIAADIYVSNGQQKASIIRHAVEMGCFNGMGLAKTFVHVDIREGEPVMWSY
jgi:hypothetical protein